MKNIKRLAATTSLILVFPLTALAVDGTTDDLPQTTGDVLKVLNNIGNWMFTGLLIISTIMLIVGAYKYLFSQGSEEATSSAKKTIVYAVIALAVAMLAKGVPALVHSVLSTNN